MADPGSFRDPSGFVFTRDGVLLRQIHRGYLDTFRAVRSSGLYDELTGAGLVMEHEDAPLELAMSPEAVAVIRPRPVPFLSYPYEWCFGQLRAAALSTLDIQGRALRKSMSLKDASPFNIQFVEGRPVHIDSLSLERHREGEPWIAYRQFCEQFLAPLALMSFADARFGRLLQVYPDGVPPDMAAAALPGRSYLNVGALLHLHLHATYGSRYESGRRDGSTSVSRSGLLGLVESLQSAVASLRFRPPRHRWDEYAPPASYSGAAAEHKQALVGSWLGRVRPRTVWDLGANTGSFSRLAAASGALVVSWDGDCACVEKNYRQVVTERERRILPLWIDLVNPSPAIGFENRDRRSLEERGPADLVLALALVHHLAIGRNVPLERLAAFFARLGRRLVLEFVPATDPQAREMLSGRAEQFSDYDEEHLRAALAPHFDLEETERLRDSERALFLLRSRSKDLPQR